MKKKINTQPVFSSSFNHGNVVLNFMGSPKSEYGLYAGAFHDAGKLLVSKLAASRGYSDLQACPIVFLYRHALELYMKAVIITGNNISWLSGKKPLIETENLNSHKLSQLVPAIKAIFSAVDWDWDLDIEGVSDDREFQRFLEDFEKTDPGSFSFRYPTTTKGDAALPEHFLFNAIEFARKLDPILDLLDGADLGLKEIWDTAAEATYEAQM